MDPERRRSIDEHDGYMTEAQLGIWMAEFESSAKEHDTQYLYKGDNLKFEAYFTNCKIYNYLYDMSEAHPDKIKICWDHKADKIDFLIDRDWPWKNAVESNLKYIESEFNKKVEKSE